MDRNDGTTDKTSEKQTKVRSISASVKSKDCMVIFLKRKRILVQMEFHMKRKSRRRLLRGITGLIASAGLTGKVATAANPTPGAAEGPFYPEPSMRAPDDDNNLVKISGLVEAAGGEVFTLRGRLTGCDGRPLAEHRIEIWQCDVNGKYQHTADNRSVAYDHAYQGFGHDITDTDGSYVFRTIKPTIYPGRAPHIHVKVFKEDQELLTTQLYIKGHPANVADGLFNRLAASQADAVSMVFVKGDTGTEATIDIVV